MLPMEQQVPQPQAMVGLALLSVGAGEQLSQARAGGGNGTGSSGAWSTGGGFWNGSGSGGSWTSAGGSATTITGSGNSGFWTATIGQGVWSWSGSGSSTTGFLSTSTGVWIAGGAASTVTGSEGSNFWTATVGQAVWSRNGSGFSTTGFLATATSSAAAGEGTWSATGSAAAGAITSGSNGYWTAVAGEGAWGGWRWQGSGSAPSELRARQGEGQGAATWFGTGGGVATLTGTASGVPGPAQSEKDHGDGSVLALHRREAHGQVLGSATQPHQHLQLEALVLAAGVSTQLVASLLQRVLDGQQEAHGQQQATHQGQQRLVYLLQLAVVVGLPVGHGQLQVVGPEHLAGVAMQLVVPEEVRLAGQQEVVGLELEAPTQLPQVAHGLSQEEVAKAASMPVVQPQQQVDHGLRLVESLEPREVHGQYLVEDLEVQRGPQTALEVLVWHKVQAGLPVALGLQLVVQPGLSMELVALVQHRMGHRRFMDCYWKQSRCNRRFMDDHWKQQPRLGLERHRYSWGSISNRRMDNWRSMDCDWRWWLDLDFHVQSRCVHNREWLDINLHIWSRLFHDKI